MLLLLSVMLLLAKYLLLSSTVLHARLSVPSTQRFQFVDLGGRTEISCTSEYKIERGGSSFGWYKRTEGELSRIITSCNDGNTAGRFVCKSDAGRHKLILQISNSQSADSGIYFCADGFWMLSFSNGTTSLIVGDSYTPSTQVLLLLPSAHPTSGFVQSEHLACMVHGVSNLVQVSWNISGELQQEGRTRLARSSGSSLTFISLLSLPMDSRMNEKSYTCEVRFNSSNTTVRRSITFPAVSPEDPKENCLIYAVPVAFLGVSASLLLLLSFLWIRLCPSRPDYSHTHKAVGTIKEEVVRKKKAWRC
ncbi:uncharacterized protein LOC128337694 isoform X2 [Hemicordylus capensis]|uniref:uncharacterized protein LOC128337694 isoform X2 n=1 Tax=Hemicordylus capensis TaxID=884348 RepID=UPI0023039C4F|nr:uncharacterized protein LOC128337694 isoform X2 [Hemicordylus capensis]